MWYTLAINNLEHGQSYPRSDIVSALKKEKSGLSENSYIWTVGTLVKDGVLQHIGRNQYTLAEKTQHEIYHPLYSDEANSICCQIEKQYPLITFTVFESVSLNEFLNHQIAGNTIFIHAERDVSAFVFDYLQESYGNTILYRPCKNEYDLYWKPNCIIILDLISEAPLFNKGTHEITIEKMLVDIYCDKAIRLTYSNAEYQTILRTAFERYNVDTVRLLRYARRRNKEKEIRAFISQREECK